jgi:hypothetical protein
MEELIELRIPEENAKAFLDSNDGVCLGGSVRKLVLSAADPLLKEIRRIDKEFQARGDFFFLGWDLRRRYTEADLKLAKAFRVIIKRVIRVTGQGCGTLYDDSDACKYCGSGGRQLSELTLPANSFPGKGNLAIAKTIAGEVVVSAKFVEICESHRVIGADFRAVRQRKDRSLLVPGWYQLGVTSRPVNVMPPTRAGTRLFDDELNSVPKECSATMLCDVLVGSWCDKHGIYRCPRGHTIGLNLLSELTVKERDFGSSDITCTKQQIGVRRGTLRPEALHVVSRRLRQLVLDYGLKGFEWEIVHLK